MHPARAKWIGLAIFLAIIAEFVLDLNAPVGTSVWIGYLLPLLLSTYVGNRFFPLVLAAILSALTLIAAYQSPPGSEIHLALANRCLGIAALAATAWFIFERKRSEQGAARARRALVTITDCNQALVRAGNEADLLHDVCRIIVESGGYPLAWVGFSEHDDECSIRPAAWAGKEGAYLEKIRISWGDNERGRGPTGTAVRTGKVTICHDLANDPNLAPWREQAMRHGFGSSIVLPLLDGSTVFGALSIYSSDVRAFDAPEEKLLTELANDLAYGVLALRARHDQQHAREKLRQSEQLYHSVVTAMAEGMVVQGVDGRIIAVNPAAEQIQGRTMAEMLGRTSDDPGWDAVRFDGTPFPGEEHPAMMTLRTGRSQSNVIMGIRQPGGERHWLSINSQPLRSAPEEPPYAVVTTFHDITEIRRAEEQIREQAQLLELAQDAIIVRDLQNRILYWNKGAERIYGWSAGEVLAKPFGQLLHIGLFEYEQARKAVMERGEWRGEMNTRSKGGLEVLIEARWTLVRDAAGAPKSVLAICTDITEKKKLENQFYRAQRLESLGTMASGIAHDLNNILTPLLVSVQLLKEKVKDDDGEKLLANLEIYVRRGAGLVRQVLSFG
ncbi:MAG TPA: PAS domain S-box protein, partial [Verrucomicrobiae bacterium]|nr:PAS domain S-box protein [Verrucomicrobiae bacterium]